MAHGLDRERAAHQEPDIHGLCQLGIGPIQVEDLLDAMLDSVKAVLRDGDGQRHQLLVFLAERAVGEDLGPQVPIGAKHASRPPQNRRIELLLSSLAVT